jgi:hypothetical protein
MAVDKEELTPLRRQELEVSERRRVEVIRDELNEARELYAHIPPIEEVDWNWVLKSSTYDVAWRFKVELATASLMKLEAHKRAQRGRI